MPVTRQQVERFLVADEPDYAVAARLGAGALPHLEAIARDADVAMAVKAVHLASLISPEGAVPVVDLAASRADPVVRVVAANALARVGLDRVGDVAVRLLADPDEGVRRRAAAALPQTVDPRLAGRLQDLADSVLDEDQKRHVVEALRKSSPTGARE